MDTYQLSEDERKKICRDRFEPVCSLAIFTAIMSISWAYQYDGVNLVHLLVAVVVLNALHYLYIRYDIRAHGSYQGEFIFDSEGLRFVGKDTLYGKWEDLFHIDLDLSFRFEGGTKIPLQKKFSFTRQALLSAYTFSGEMDCIKEALDRYHIDPDLERDDLTLESPVMFELDVNERRMRSLFAHLLSFIPIVIAGFVANAYLNPFNGLFFNLDTVIGIAAIVIGVGLTGFFLVNIYRYHYFPDSFTVSSTGIEIANGRKIISGRWNALEDVDVFGDFTFQDGTEIIFTHLNPLHMKVLVACNYYSGKSELFDEALDRERFGWSVG